MSNEIMYNERNKRINNTLNLFPELKWASAQSGLSDLIISDPNFQVFLVKIKGKSHVQKFMESNYGNNSSRIINFITEIAKIQNVAFTYDYPSYSTEIPDYGYRIVATRPPITKNYTCSIRLGNRTIFPLESYCGQRVADYLIDLIQKNSAKKTVVVAGGTSTGKTSFMNSWLQYLNPTLRIVAVENMREITVSDSQENISTFLSVGEGNSFKNQQQEVINPYQLCVDIMNRSAPDFIIFGELTYQSSGYWLRSCNLDCSSMATLHADSAQKVVLALTGNIAQSTKGLIQPLEKDILSVLSHIVQLKRDDDTGKRSAEVFEVVHHTEENNYSIEQVI